MIGTLGLALTIVAGAIWIALEIRWNRQDKAWAARRHVLARCDHGQAVTVRCGCGQEFTSATEDSAMRSWIKHRYHEDTRADSR